jgi:hypothetical protein
LPLGQGGLPFVLGADACDWVFPGVGNQQPSSAQSKLAWRGPNGVDEDDELVLYVKAWENPFPDTEIASLDFVSAMAEPTPFLLGVTLE